jgi:two-component system chemotaxis response regulator CheB
MSSDAPRFDLVVVGTSAGGFDAICRLISLLPASFPIPIAIVQHRSRESDALAGLLQDCTQLRVCEVEDKQPAEPGYVYVAPPDYHLLVDDDCRFSLSVDGLVGYSRPSIDVFFESAADAFGARLIGVVMTGANADGSRGLLAIAQSGGQALVQDPDTAEVRMMPESARTAVKSARILTIDGIAERLIQLAGAQSAERKPA